MEFDQTYCMFCKELCVCPLDRPAHACDACDRNMTPWACDDCLSVHHRCIACAGITLLPDISADYCMDCGVSGRERALYTTSDCPRCEGEAYCLGCLRVGASYVAINPTNGAHIPVVSQVVNARHGDFDEITAISRLEDQDFVGAMCHCTARALFGEHEAWCDYMREVLWGGDPGIGAFTDLALRASAEDARLEQRE